MKEIPLTQGKVALIDDEDFGKISPYAWGAQRDGRTFYAVTSVRREGGGQSTVLMHRLILGLTDRAVRTDHVDGNGLDNRRLNIRPATPTQNNRNRRLNANNASGYKGVTFRGGRWRAGIRYEGRRLCLGTFDTPEAAASVYDAKAIELFGPFALTNFELRARADELENA